jgi:hypothetical protein
VTAQHFLGGTMLLVACMGIGFICSGSEIISWSVLWQHKFLLSGGTVECVSCSLS